DVDQLGSFTVSVAESAVAGQGVPHVGERLPIVAEAFVDQTQPTQRSGLPIEVTRASVTCEGPLETVLSLMLASQPEVRGAQVGKHRLGAVGFVPRCAAVHCQRVLIVTADLQMAVQRSGQVDAVL